MPQGRGELLSLKKGKILIDFAHDNLSIRNILSELANSYNEIIVVFGCGGDRDKSKRLKMGRIASKFADVIYLTDDNPRNEDATAIRDQIKLGAPDAIEIPNRMDAISNAIKGLSADDVLIIAGKGHEKGQIIGDAIIPFDDVSAVKSIIGEKI